MPQDLDSLRAHVAILRHCKAKRAELAEMEANSRAAIEEALGDEEEGTLDGSVAILWKRHKRNALNQKLLQKLHPEVAAECMEVTEVRRLQVIEERD